MHLEFWCTATVTFKFTVLYNNIYRNKKQQLKLAEVSPIFKKKDVLDKETCFTTRVKRL